MTKSTTEAEKQIEFLTTCDQETFNREFKKSGFSRWPPEVRKAALERLDRDIEEAGGNLEGVPNAKNLSRANGGPLPYSESLIRQRLDVNLSLNKSCISRGVEFVSTCDKETFYHEKYKWVQADAKVKAAINTRIEKDKEEAKAKAKEKEKQKSLEKQETRTAIHSVDQQIDVAIRSFEGVPNYKNLSEEYGGPLPFIADLIKKRLKANPALEALRISRGVEWVQNCDETTFQESLNGWAYTPRRVKEAIEQRRREIENRILLRNGKAFLQEFKRTRRKNSKPGPQDSRLKTQKPRLKKARTG